MTKHLRFVALLLLPILASLSLAQVDPQLYGGLKWRSIGPYRGGRSVAIAGSTQRPKEYYFGATGGGVWKTTDGGENWFPAADAYLKTASIGAVAIAPSNPDIVVIGMGERDIRGNISEGDGVYKTSDGGKTWTHMGLAETKTISKIVIHPTNPDIIYVAALGPVYTHPGVPDSPARGVYKSTDGGQSWNKVLPGFARAGAVDLQMDPKNPNVLLAATWEAWRSPWALNSGGEGSHMFKSTDAGQTWTDLTRKPGLPSGIIGKIGMAISPVDPNRYWALVEALDGGLFLSDDAGATWKLVNDSRNWRQRAWYYTHVIADPKAKDTVYVLNVGAGKSTDAGKSFSGLNTEHGDNHDLWIAPDDPKRMAASDDGGGSVSVDGGQSWTAQTYPTGQIYHVNTDNAFPYRVLGAQQDNSTIRIPSRTQGGGITRTDWTSTAGAESGYVTPKPNDPDVVFGGNYGGDLSWLNHRTGQGRAVDPWPDNPMGHGAIDLVHRFQWTFPIVFSPHNPNKLYTCSQYVLATTNDGQTWKKISPDLTRNDPATLASSGGPITKDNTSVEYYGTVFAFGESPKREGVLWAGSDDGLVHVSQDGGKTWTNVTPRGMPKWGLVSSVEPSPHDAATCYLAVDNHENNDYAPYAYRTTDYGKTWTAINGLANDAPVRVIREDKRRKGLLYAGTETGAWVSFNGGASWQSLQLNLPVTPVHDLQWKDDDLVAATHGRGFWILDDVSPLQQLVPTVTAAKPVLFAPRDSYRVRWGSSPRGAGANPMSGVIVSYFLPSDANDVKLEFKDAEGKVVQTVASAPKGKGFQRTSAFLQYPSYKPTQGMIFWAAGPRPFTAPPGTYTVSLTVDGMKQEQKFRWLKDPRSTSTDKDAVEQFRFLRQIAARVEEANDAVLRVRSLRTALDKASTDLEGKPNAVAARGQIDALKGRLTLVEEAIYQTKNRSGQDPLNYPIRLNNKIAALMGVVASGDYRPTDQSYEVFDRLSKELAVELAKLNQLTKVELAAVNDELKKAGLTPIP
ncbi:MAG: WD40/YVTN/BNR-like repeat-containing protein [Fimbriimonas sp.]